MKQRLLLLLPLLLVACLNIDPSKRNGDLYIKQGAQYYSAGQNEKAIVAFNRGLKRKLKRYTRAEALLLLGCAHAADGNDSLAIEILDSSLRYDSTSTAAWNNRGISMRRINNLTEAEKSYKKAIAIDDRYVEAHSSLGTLYVLQDKAEMAVTTFEKALSIDSTLGTTVGNYALALAMAGNIEKAEKMVQKSRRLGYANASYVEKRIRLLQE